MTELIIFTLIFTLTLAGIGFRLQYGTTAEIALRRQASGWPKTTGAVTGGQVVRHKASFTQIGGGAGLRTINLDRFEPEVSYTYQVNGVEYQSSKYRNGLISRGGGWSTIYPKQAEKIVDEHPQGKAVSVIYNPANPAQAYLDLDTATRSQQTSRIVGFVFYAAAILLLAVGALRVVENLSTQSTVSGIPANISKATEALKADLVRELGLTCRSSNAAGQQMSYTRWECEKKTGNKTASLNIWSRKLAPDKVDSVRVQALNFDPAEELAFLTTVAKLVVPAADSQQVQDWLSKTKPTLTKAGSTADTTLGGVKFTYSNPYGMNTLLEIGAIK